LRTAYRAGITDAGLGFIMALFYQKINYRYSRFVRPHGHLAICGRQTDDEQQIHPQQKQATE
jgi:hypothetical protein